MVVELIAKDKSEKQQYEGRCKLIIDSVSKLLLVEPFIEEFKMISAMFKWQFVSQKNVLFIFAEFEFQDYALIFDDSNKCSKISNFLLKKGATIGNDQLVKKRFLPSLFAEIFKREESNLKIKEILVRWIEQFEGKEKEEYIQMLKNYSVYDLIYLNRKESRQKKTAKMEQNKSIENNYNSADSAESDTEKPRGKMLKHFPATNEIIVKPNFQLFQYTKKGIQKATLIIFCPTNKKLCYEFYRNNKDRRYICLGCEKTSYVTAKIRRNAHGEDYVKLKNRHICELREFDPSKYRSDIVIPKTMYEIVENNAPKRKHFIVFTSAEKKLCYKFSGSNYNRSFHCSKCRHQKHYIRAYLYKDKNGEEYISMQDKEHICKPVEYFSKKLKYKIVKATDFEIMKRRVRGKWVQKLFVFTSKDFCYEYTWHEKRNYYICNPCINVSKVFVNAKIVKNGDAEEYVQLNWKDHVCKPVKYEPQNSILMFKPDFEIKKCTYRGAVNTYLFVNDPRDKNLQYKYIFCKTQNRFICNGCRPKSVMAKLWKDENGEEYIEMGKAEHVCQSKEEASGRNTINHPNFKVVNDGKDLFIFDENDRTLCYSYIYHPSRKNFLCRKCIAKKRKVSATLLQYRNGEDHLRTGKNNHICKPQKYKPVPVRREYRFKNY